MRAEGMLRKAVRLPGPAAHLRTLASALPTEPAMGMSASVAPSPAMAGPQLITRTSRPMTTKI